jgi:cytoskeleton protein RodZ
METTSFGSVLREARESRRISLADVANKTKLSPASLQMLEEGRLDVLPPEIFVRGFIRSYARSVGIEESQPLGLFDQELDARRRAEEAMLATPVPQASGDSTAAVVDDDAPRRGIGLAVFVIILLLIATITLSLFLRQPPRSGESLSQGEAAGTLVDDGSRGG